jgi:hypothetical protein
MDMRQRVVVCAAVRLAGVMLVGPRHLDYVMLTQYRRAFSGENAPDVHDGEMGFLDQEGVFMDRIEALEVAQAADQIRDKTEPSDRLFSEDLY